MKRDSRNQRAKRPLVYNTCIHDIMKWSRIWYRVLLWSRLLGKLVPLAPSKDKRRSWPTNSHGNSGVWRKSISVYFEGLDMLPVLKYRNMSTRTVDCNP